MPLSICARTTPRPVMMKVPFPAFSSKEPSPLSARAARAAAGKTSSATSRVTESRRIRRDQCLHLNYAVNDRKVRTVLSDTTHFGLIILLCSGALAAALLASKATARTAIPAPAVFLVVAALLSDVFPALALSTTTVERIATLALIVILFDGGASIGARRFRAATVPIAMLGTVGAFATAGLVAV